MCLSHIWFLYQLKYLFPFKTLTCSQDAVGDSKLDLVGSHKAAVKANYKGFSHTEKYIRGKKTTSFSDSTPRVSHWHGKGQEVPFSDMKGIT